MTIWVIAGAVSVVLTAVMTVLLLFFAMLGFGGAKVVSEAMSFYFVLSCVAWPVMFGLTSLSSWLVFAIAKRPSSRKQLLLMNGLIVTAALGIALIVVVILMN